MIPAETWMRRAIELARRGWGTTHPNPMVGALILENHEPVAEGWHEKAGGPHAERRALAALGRKPRQDAILVVTLEPCSTTGRTPPCVDAILESGIRRVVVGATDPDPRHRGEGCRALRAAGVEVVEGVLAAECEDLNLIFHHRMETGRPLVAMKVAATADGRIATRRRESQWITGDAAREDVMRWRRYFPAIGVGAGTVLADNPRLTSRVDGTVERPLRFVFDRNLVTVPQADQYRVYADLHGTETMVVCASNAPPESVAALEARGVAVLPMASGPTAHWWPRFLKALIDADLWGIWLEGGHSLLSKLLAAGVVDYAFLYRAPKLLFDDAAVSIANCGAVESLSGAIGFDRIQRATFGTDDLLRGFLVRANSGT